jgi:small subunit ribosomal protein S16
MATKIRLQLFGVPKRPFYRVVVSESKNARDGKFLEILGTYDTIVDIIELDRNKVQKWLSNGAQPTKTVKKLFKKSKFIATTNTKVEK